MKLANKYNSPERIEIVVLDDEIHTVLSKNIISGLKALSFKSFFDLPVLVKGFDDVEIMLDYLGKNRWRYTKVILLDYILQKKDNSAELQSPCGVALIETIKKNNPSIDIWGISAIDPEGNDGLTDKNLINFRQNVKGLYDKRQFLDKNQIKDILRNVIINPLEDKVKTPFFSEFKNYVEQSTKSWHVPGHNRGQALYNSKFGRHFYDFFGSVAFSADHDIPKKFGSIFTSDPSENSIINETQSLIASTFNAKQTYFVTNGNSASNNIILMSLLKPQDEVLVARSCHKSIHYALILSGANPTYLNSIFSNKYEIMAPPSVESIEKKLKGKPKGSYRLLILTGCSYEGLIMDISRINNLCNEYDTELFVDEAWYGYSNFHPRFQKTSATRLGVPYVTQSVHKMMSAFRQSAFIHVNSKKLDTDFFKDTYNIFTSTSPQYQLIASMDVAAMQMRIEGFELIDRALERAELFRKDFVNLEFKKIKLITEYDLADDFKSLGYDFEKEGISYDPLKISFDISKLGINVKDAFDFIRKNAGVDLIKYTSNCIQILFTIGTAFDRNKPAQLITTLKKLEDSNFKTFNVEAVAAPEINELTYGSLLPRDYFYGKRELIEIADSVGNYSATLVTPYPPGIPILVPGELINESHVKYLNQIKKQGHISVHGIKGNKLYIFRG